MKKPPVYLCPRKRYSYAPPKGLRREKTTAPFESVWILHLGDAAAPAVRAWHETEGAKREHCRLAFGFKKRRGVPGFATALDQDGWLLETKERKQARDLLQLPTAVPMATRPAKRAKIGACELKRTGGIPLKAQGPKGLRLALSPGPPPSGVNTGNKRQQKKKRSKGVRKLSKPSTETA